LRLNIIPFPQLRKDFSIDGFLAFAAWAIYVDQDQMLRNENRYRFTLAHEVAADFRIDFKFNRARDVRTIDKSMLGKLLGAEIRRHLTISVGRHRGLETETTVHLRLDFLPCAD
jgi:hypothetical protein